MSTKGNKGSVNRVVEYVYLAVGGQALFSGPDMTGLPMSFRNGRGLVEVYVNGRLAVPGLDYTLLGNTQVLLAQQCDPQFVVMVRALFPYNAVDGLTVAASDAAYGRRRNKFFDPGLRVSQEQGDALLTAPANGSVYPCDTLPLYRMGSTGTITVQRKLEPTPGGSPYRVRATVTAVNAAPAASDAVQLYTKVEGYDVADLRFGTSSARTVGVRFGCRSSIAGTFPVSLQNANGGAARSWIGNITIAQNEVGLDVVRTLTIPGDITGTWFVYNQCGLQLNVTLSSGSNYQGVAGWQGGNMLALPGSTNLMATNGATFDLFDLGLFDVTTLTSGVIPPFEMGPYSEDLLKCQRYFEYVPTTAVSNVVYLMFFFKAEKRVAPSLTVAAGSANGATFSNGGGNDVTRKIRQESASSGASDCLFAVNARM